MPIYEYNCNACGRRAQIFFRSFSAVGEARCPHCKSSDLGRVVSRVAYVHSESSYQDFLSDPASFESVDYEDPKAVAQWAQKMGEAAGVDIGPDYQQMMENLGDGAAPEGLGADFGDDF
ncbi:MAG: zinc ribbon domain-containing protein [Chloroflexi bacterium]|nr:zinc ribbon domain-containing protein [Chloroflexota bacterium]